MLALALVPAARAAGWVWTVSFAQSKLEVEYQTVDPWALKDATVQLRADLAAGYPESSTQVRHDRQDVTAAKRGAYPRWARCRGVGKADRHGTPAFARLWCSVRLGSYSTQYEATKKVTLLPRGREAFRVRSGWH